MIKIGDFANLFNVSIKTIRYYESIGLIIPKYVDIYSGYRYFDEENVRRMQEIIALKKLGFSLKEIKHFDDKQISNKIKEFELEILDMKNKISTLKDFSLHGKKVLEMQNFINDERAIGKWCLLGVAENLEKAKNEKFMEDDFHIQELYLLPNGEAYWVISWTKNTIYINGRPYCYEIINDKLYLTITDLLDSSLSKVVVYYQADNKEYTQGEIKNKDKTDIAFVADSEIVGFWHTIDFINNPNSFSPNKKQCDDDMLSLTSLSFKPNGEVYVGYKSNDYLKYTKYTKDYIIDLVLPDTLSKYIYKKIDGKTYLIVEWKSGDYVFGKMINGYYVLEKE